MQPQTNSGNEEVLGRQGLGKINENGEKLADLCAFKGNNNKALYTFLLLHIHEVYYYM